MDRRSFFEWLVGLPLAANQLTKAERARLGKTADLVVQPVVKGVSLNCSLCKSPDHQPTYGMLRYRSVHGIDSGGYCGGSYEMLPDAALTCWCPNAPVSWKHYQIVGNTWGDPYHTHGHR